MPLLAQRSPVALTAARACCSEGAEDPVTALLPAWAPLAWLNKPPERCALLAAMADFSILTDESALVVARAGSLARQMALAAGHPVVFIDSAGRYVEERPSGRRYEIRLDPSHVNPVIVLRELNFERSLMCRNSRL